jgi:polyferredoxin
MKRQNLRRALLLVSLLLFPLTLNYFSPYLIIQGSFEGVLSGSGMLFLSLFLTSMILGRAFCGWLCPAGSLGEICMSVSNKTVGRRSRFVKYLIWAPWLATIVFGFVRAGGLKRTDIFYYTDGGISVNAPAGYIVYFSVIALILILGLSLGKRGFCHSVCWMAPFMVTGCAVREKLGIPGLRLVAEPDKCISCNACTKACPMGLDVNAMVKANRTYDRDCILCASCADVCPKGVLKVRFSGARNR